MANRTNPRIRLIVLISTLSIGLSTARADIIYYVDAAHSSASDSNPGTESLPWLTIQQAADSVSAGDTVIVKEGTYNERVTFPAGASGQPGEKTTFLAQPYRSAIIWGFDTRNADHLRIEGFDITNNFTGAWGNSYGIYVRSNNVEIIGNYLHHLYGRGIESNSSNNIRIANNTMYYVGAGMIVRGINWIVENNEIERLVEGAGDCDYSRFFGSNHILRNNYMHGTLESETGASHTDCFQTYWNNGNDANNIIIEKNICLGFFRQGVIADANTLGSHSDLTIRNNIFANGSAWGVITRNVSNVVVVNNVFANVGYFGVGLRGASDNAVIKNNIFYNTGDSDPYFSEATNLDADYNLIYGRTETNPAPNDLLGLNPLFIDAANDDYRLQENSPAIDAGDLNYVTSPGDVDKDDNLRVVDGNGDGIARIDMGPYEFQKYCGGTGTAEDPYLLCAPVHMQQIGANHDDWDKHFKLMADIDLSAYTGPQFNIIGWYEDGLNNEPFTGVFDGNGHAISNFTYTSAGASYVGLFGYVTGETVVIRDLVLIDPNINSTAGISVGALAGCIGDGTTVSDCYVKGGTVTGNKKVGALAGWTGEAAVSRCSADCDVTGNGWGIGGLIGDAWQTTISECYATGSVTADNWGVGGLVGHQYEGEILTSYATGPVRGTDNGVGGLVGNAEYALVTHCYAAGSARGVDEVGGLAGRYCYGDILASFWDTLASGQADGVGYDEQNGTVEVYDRTTTQMRQRTTFIDYGWDFTGEIANGTEDVWTIWEGAYYPRLAWENALTGDFTIDDKWMYQNLPGATTSTLTTTVSVTNDPLDNNSYTYQWEFVLPDDVGIAPLTLTGGLSGDAFWTFAAPACDQPDGLSDSGRPFKVRLTVVGDDHGNTGKAQAEFGIALIGDVNNDTVINVADRSIINAFWRLGAAGPFTFKDCDVNCDSSVNVADRSIANAVWRGVLGQNRVSQPCPLR